MPDCPDIEYSLEYQLHRRLLEQRYEWRHPRYVDMYLPIRVLKGFVALDVVVLLHQIPVVQPFAL